MIVIIRQFSNGEESYCDARCHNSTKKKCTCICKGLLHGKGEAYARAEAVSACGYLNRMAGAPHLYFPALELLPDHGGR